MSAIPAFLRKLVVRRAGNAREYCHLSQTGQEATFHIDHVVPVASGGETVAENLALACVSYSLRKGAKESAIDSETKSKFTYLILERTIGMNTLNGTALL